MNRYGIPKEDSKELKNNIDNSSSGGGTSGGDYYLVDIEAVEQYYPEIVEEVAGIAIFGSLIKYIVDNGRKYQISGSYPLYTFISTGKAVKIIAFKYDKSFTEGKYVDVKEMFESMDLDSTNFDKAFPRITEEEFYDLNKWSLEDYK